MSSGIHFETPENVQISYQPAGLGTRFLAWLADFALTTALSVILLVGSLVIGTIVGVSVEEVLKPMEDALEKSGQGDQHAAQQVVLYFVGVGWLAAQVGSFFYFLLSELCLRGQTLGKRLLGIRVVKVNGFALDPLSVFVRNFFRIVEQTPPLWLIPLLSQRSQRAGDMVAGTLVVSDRREDLPLVREELAARTAVDARYRFDHAALGRLRPGDIDAVEKIVDRWDDIPAPQLNSLLDTILEPLSRRLKVDPPQTADRLQFLEDLLAAEYRRQSRSLG